MDKQLYIISARESWGADPVHFTVNVPKTCKDFFDWLLDEGIVDPDVYSMVKVEGHGIAFDAKESK